MVFINILHYIVETEQVFQMSKKDKSKQATRKSAKREEDDQPARTRARNARREDLEEMLPSDTNDSADISPRIAFLAYN